MLAIDETGTIFIVVPAGVVIAVISVVFWLLRQRRRPPS